MGETVNIDVKDKMKKIYMPNTIFNQITSILIAEV